MKCTVECIYSYKMVQKQGHTFNLGWRKQKILLTWILRRCFMTNDKNVKVTYWILMVGIMEWKLSNDKFKSRDRSVGIVTRPGDGRPGSNCRQGMEFRHRHRVQTVCSTVRLGNWIYSLSQKDYRSCDSRGSRSVVCSITLNHPGVDK